MKVNLDNIQDSLNILLEKLKKSQGIEIELESDFYWDISLDEIYNPYEEPKNITLGQLSDDLAVINKNIIDDSIIPYDLKRLANIFTAISVECSFNI